MSYTAFPNAKSRKNAKLGLVVILSSEKEPLSIIPKIGSVLLSAPTNIYPLLLEKLTAYSRVSMPFSIPALLVAALLTFTTSTFSIEIPALLVDAAGVFWNVFIKFKAMSLASSILTL